MKNILVPTDFSEQAENAAEVAAAIARKVGAHIQLLHVIDLPSYVDSPSFRLIAESSEIKQKADVQIEELAKKAFFDGVTVSFSVEYDSPYQCVVDTAKRDDYELIVIGSHGTSGIEKFLIGSVTEKVIQFAPCPVLAVKNRMESFDVKSLVFASNFFGEISENFQQVQKFADLYGAKIHLLKVNTRHHFASTRYNRNIIEGFVDECHVRNYTVNIYDDGTEEEGILHFCEETNPDLLVIPTHGRTGLSHLINGSLAENLSEHSPRPVLCIKVKHVPIKYGIIGPYSK
ncbi:UspA domain protein [Chloroherpeton thalassium ATCC 35110]|uniref:UspA domain protein n=1 Tax=Chloroherpeton thalassium (strain ATCC 35110 / GB-78) TaxID=517418 RepID=B3QW95_CHLT3|nr:universal stress protein [Chloroherpeton thalassium]ACF13208.1 UspA domain protein [Chloroherpeton thalassium ATCC 35110]